MPPHQPSQSNKHAAPHSRTFLRQLVLVQVCILSLAVLVYAWFTSSNYAGSRVRYVQDLIIGTEKVEIQTYSGKLDAETQKIIYDETDSINLKTFDFPNKLPGDHQYFMTVIQNTDLDAPAQLSLYLDDIYYSPVLGSGKWVKIEVTYPAIVDAYLPTLTPAEIADLNAQAADPATATNQDYPGLAHVDNVRLTDTLYIPAATQDTDGKITPGEARVYWNVAFSEDIDSTAMESYVQFTKFRIMYNS